MPGCRTFGRPPSARSRSIPNARIAFCDCLKRSQRGDAVAFDASELRFSLGVDSFGREHVDGGDGVALV